jgi:hypothetical protein
LGLGAASAGLDLDEAVVGIERIVEHPLEFEFGDLLCQPGDVGLDRDQRRVVLIGARHLEQLARIAHAGFQRVHLLHDQVEALLLPPQFLCALGIVPDLWVFQRAADFLESTLLRVDVKDTSGVQRGGRAGRQSCLRSD